MSQTSTTDAKRDIIGEAIGIEIAEQLKTNTLGVTVNIGADFAPEACLDSLAEQTDYNIGLVFDGVVDDEVIDQLDDEFGNEGIHVDNEVGTSIEWRNNEDTGHSWDGSHVPDRIVVVVQQEPAKINSLHRFEKVPAGRIRRQIASVMKSREPFNSNDPSAAVWTALEGNFGDNFSIPTVANYAAAVDPDKYDNNREAIKALGEELAALRLLPDSSLTDSVDEVQERLENNLDLINRLTNISSTDEERLTKSVLNAENETERDDRANIITAIRDFQRGNQDRLAELEYKTVEDLLSTSIRSGGGRPKYTDPTTTTLDSIAGNLSDEESSGFEEAIESFDDELEDAFEKNESTVRIEYGDNNWLRVSEGVDEDLWEFLKEFTGDSSFGGIIEDTESLDEAIKEFNSHPTRIFNPESEESTFDTMRDYAERHEEFEPIVDRLDSFIELREELSEKLAKLFYIPFPALTYDDDLRETVWDYLEAYEETESIINNKYEAFQDRSPAGASKLLSEFLLLDTISVETAQGHNMVLTPLHPLHLWKYAELAQSTYDSDLDDEEFEFLVDTGQNLPHLLRSIDLSGNRILGSNHLVQDEELGSLPVYIPDEYADMGTNAELWEYLFNKFSLFDPPAKNRFRLSVVDPLRPGQLLDAIDAAAENGAIGGCEVELAYINTENKGPLYGSRNTEGLIDRFGPSEDGSNFDVVVLERYNSYDEYVSDHLAQSPKHVTLINDRSLPKIEEFERDRDIEVHPFHVPKVFSYDEFNDRIDIHPSPEGYLFSEYQNLVNSLNNRRNEVHNSNVFDLRVDGETLSTFAEHSTWAVLSTPSTNTDQFPTTEANLISRQTRGDRDYGFYAESKDYFVRRLNRLFNRYPLPFDEEDLETVAEESLDAYQGGLLDLITEESVHDDPSNIKGILGTILALDWLDYWIDNPTLIFSIDDPKTRRWLNLDSQSRRADYLVVELSEDAGLRINVVEVKAFDDPSEVLELDGEEVTAISDSVVEQLTSSTSTIRYLFDKDDNLTVKPRRAALREAIYYELVSQEPDGDKAEWVNRINALFSGDVDVEIQSHVVSLELTNESHYRPVSAAHTSDSRREITVHRVGRDETVRLVTGEEPESEPDQTEQEDKEDEEQPEEVVETETNDETEATEESELDKASKEKQLEGASAFGDPSAYENLVDELKQVLWGYDIEVAEIAPEKIEVGPNVIRFKVKLASGERQQAVIQRTEDIARELALERKPIVHRLPNTEYLAIDIPRSDRVNVSLHDYLDELPDEDDLTVGDLPFIAGVTPAGEARTANLRNGPHMLVGGTTGSGKTVFLQSIILALHERYGADYVNFAIVDLKGRDFKLFNHLDNLVTEDVITEPEAAHELFTELADEEIDRRDEILDESMSVDIIDHNSREGNKIIPTVVVIDEYAELLDQVEDPDGLEQKVRQIAQIARAHGIHLVVSTQRPSAKVIDTDLRANLDMRAAFRVPKSEDSRVILDESGAEELGGKGDMLFKTANSPVRLQGTLVEPDDIRKILRD